jgi:hypothetical protein
MEKPVTKEIVEAFQWRMHGGEIVSPVDMATSHLFYTVRMIWNHRMPGPYRFPNCKQWELNYSSVYLLKAIRVMLWELSTRDEKKLNALQRTQLQRMIELTRRYQLLVEKRNLTYVQS